MTYTQEEQERITDALKALCVAKAEFWDALRAVEIRVGNVEVDTTPELEGTLAAEYNTPPGVDDVSDDAVWEAFLENVTTKFYSGTFQVKPGGAT